MATLAQHALSINRTIGAGTQCTIHKGTLRARLTLQPTPLSRLYTIGIVYPTHGLPTVSVIDPMLEGRPADQRLPHVYEGNRLCLSLPDEWTHNDLLGDTIIPWTAEWLLYYEIWLATDTDWLGGGHP